MNAITRIENMTQGSPEWHAHRTQYDNASEAAAVLGISPFFPKTPRQLWSVRMGTAKVFVNSAMTRGQHFEAEARQEASEALGIDFEPAVFTRGPYSASLDGISACGKIALEIKVPAKGEDSDLWKAISAGEVPPHYEAQVAQQLYCSGAEEVVFWVYVPEQRIGAAYRLTAAELAPMWARVEAAWEAFRASQEAMEPPAPMADDEVPVEDPDLLSAASELIDVRRELDRLSAREEALERILKAALPSSHASTLETASGTLRAQWITRQGAIDYAKVPVLKGLDLEPYRKKATHYMKLIEVKQ